MIVSVIKVFVVIGLLTVAAALATPPGRLPLALRGLQKMMNRDKTASAPRFVDSSNGEEPKSRGSEADRGQATLGKRLFAFLLVCLAVILAVV